MARTLIRGETQIMPESIGNAEIAVAAGIELSKIEKGTSIVLADGTAVTGNINLDGNKIYGAGAGVDPNDLVTKAQLDSVSAGLDAKGASHVATTGYIDLLATTATDTIDGEVLTAGQRILVKDQSGNGVATAVINNGGTGYTGGDVLTIVGGTGTAATVTVDSVTGGVIDSVTILSVGQYTVDPSATAGVTGGTGGDDATIDLTFYDQAVDNGIYDSATPWTRSTDFDGSPANEVSGGSFSFVEVGTINGGTGWIVVAEGDIVVGTDNIIWTQFSGASSYTGGDGITITGSVISADTDNSTIGINGSAKLYIPNGGITATQLNASVAGSGISGGAGTALSLDLDGATLTLSGAGVKVSDAGITENQIASTAFLSTGGLQGGTGTKISVKPYWGITTTTNGVSVVIDGTTLALTASGLKVAALGITAVELAADSVTAAKINPDVAGLGLVSNGTTGALDVNVDDSTIQIDTDVVKVKAGGITETEINSSALGTGLTGGSGTVISVDSTAFLALSNYIVRENHTAEVDGVTDTFTLVNTPIAGTEHVYVNGVLMEDGGNDYTLTGSDIVFEFVPKYNAGNADKTDKIVVTYLK